MKDIVQNKIDDTALVEEFIKESFENLHFQLLRGAERRGNPISYRMFTRLLRFARNDNRGVFQSSLKVTEVTCCVLGHHPAIPLIPSETVSTSDILSLDHRLFPGAHADKRGPL